MATRRFQLFVAKLPWTVCSDTLKEYFMKYGPVTSARVIFDYETGRSKKYGFVDFEKPESVEKVMADPSHFIEGEMIHVQNKVHEKTSQKTRQFANQTNRTERVRDYSEV